MRNQAYLFFRLMFWISYCKNSNSVIIVYLHEYHFLPHSMYIIPFMFHAWPTVMTCLDTLFPHSSSKIINVLTIHIHVVTRYYFPGEEFNCFRATTCPKPIRACWKLKFITSSSQIKDFFLENLSNLIKLI